MIVSTVVGSTALKIYEFYPSIQPTLERRQFSHDTITLSLPIRSIDLSRPSNDSHPPDNPRVLPFLSVQVINPVLGTGVHYYNIVKPTVAPVANNANLPLYSRFSKLNFRHVYAGMCGIPIALCAPRLLAVCPLNHLTKRFILQHRQFLGDDHARLNLVIMSNGDINLARSLKNTTLLSQNPFSLPKDALELFEKPDSGLHTAITLEFHPDDPGCMTCLLIVRPLAITGEILVIKISLNDLLDPTVTPNSRSRCLTIERAPFGYRPLFTRIDLRPNEQIGFSGLLVGSTEDEGSKCVCLCDKVNIIPAVNSQLFAYAAEAHQILVSDQGSISRIQAAGCFEGNNGVLRATPITESTIPSNPLGKLTGVFITCGDGKVHATVQPVSFLKMDLKGFAPSELPQALVINKLDKKLVKHSDTTLAKTSSILCLSSLNRLLYWPNIEDLNSISQSTPPPSMSPQQICFADNLVMTLAPTDSSTRVVLALDTDSGQLIGGSLPENSLDLQKESNQLQTTWSYSIGARKTLGIKDFRNQLILLEPQESRFLALLYILNDTDRCRSYRIVVLDLKQQPYSPGIVGLNDFEVEKNDLNRWNSLPQLKWSHYLKDSTFSAKNECFLALCYGSNLAKIYSRSRDGWWKQSSHIQSRSLGLLHHRMTRS